MLEDHNQQGFEKQAVVVEAGPAAAPWGGRRQRDAIHQGD
jgi:hypothetical protein